MQIESEEVIQFLKEQSAKEIAKFDESPAGSRELEIAFERCDAIFQARNDFLDLLLEKIDTGLDNG